MNVFLIDAINSLAPGAAFAVKTNEEIVWLDETHTQPTQENIIQKVAELEYLEEINQYKTKRQAEYPNYAEYLDGVVKGDQDQIDAYIAACQAVKDKYPKVEIDETEIVSRKAQALSDYQLEEYTKAQARLDQYQVALGREQVTEMQDSHIQLTDSDGVPQYDSDSNPVYEQIEVITVTAIDPVEATVTISEIDSDGAAVESEVPNPLITKDNEERATAQAVVDATPQPVIDQYNS